MSGGGDTQETVQKVQIDPTAKAMQQRLWDAGGSMAAPFLQTPAYGVAGINPDQEQAFSVARVGAQNAFSTNAPQLNYGSIAPQAAQLSAGEIGQFVSPYVQPQYEANVSNMRRERDNQLAQADAQGAAAGSFGGSGTALQRGQINRSFGEQAGTMGANLNAQAYQQALQAAMQNAQFRQQANLQGASNQISAFGANNTALNDAQARSMQWLNQLISQGDYQRKAQQQAIDLPFTILDRLRSLTPQQLESTTTKTEPDNSPSGLQQGLGAGLSILGLGMGGGTTLGGSLLGKLFK